MSLSTRVLLLKDQMLLWILSPAVISWVFQRVAFIAMAVTTQSDCQTRIPGSYSIVEPFVLEMHILHIAMNAHSVFPLRSTIRS